MPSHERAEILPPFERSIVLAEGVMGEPAHIGRGELRGAVMAERAETGLCGGMRAWSSMGVKSRSGGVSVWQWDMRWRGGGVRRRARRAYDAVISTIAQGGRIVGRHMCSVGGSGAHLSTACARAVGLGARGRALRRCWSWVNLLGVYGAHRVLEWTGPRSMAVNGPMAEGGGLHVHVLCGGRCC